MNTHPASFYALHLLSAVQPEEDFKTQLYILVSCLKQWLPFSFRVKHRTLGKLCNIYLLCFWVNWWMPKSSFLKCFTMLAAPFLSGPLLLPFLGEMLLFQTCQDYSGLSYFFHRKFLPDHAMPKSSPHLIRDSLSPAESLGVSKCSSGAWIFSRPICRHLCKNPVLSRLS